MSFLRKNAPALALLVIGAVFLAIGVWQGDVASVLTKATNVCMECIGLG